MTQSPLTFITDLGEVSLHFCLTSACYANISKSFSYMLFDELLRFLGEIKSGNFTVSNSEITTFYSVFFSLFVNSFDHR